MPEHKPDRISYDVLSILMIWGSRIFHLAVLIWLLSFPKWLLFMTPTLWGPKIILSQHAWVNALAEPAYVSEGFWEKTAQILNDDDPPGRCMNASQKLTAISGPLDVVSGWYGPGSYLAWLVAAYFAAFSTIWHSKCSPARDESRHLDAETIVVLGYPFVAMLDIVVKLIRCQIDPGINAACFVLLSALIVVGPTARLSWQWRTPGMLADLEGLFQRSLRGWVLEMCLLAFFVPLYAVMEEPYFQDKAWLWMLGILLVCELYSFVNGETYSTTAPYISLAGRPPVERVAFFAVAQIVYHSMLLYTRRSIWPESSGSLMDMDQIAALLTAVVALLYSKRNAFLTLVRGRPTEGERGRPMLEESSQEEESAV